MHTWTWAYTFIVAVLLLAVFLVAGVALILRPGTRRMRRTPQSIATPLGYVPYRSWRPMVSGPTRHKVDE